MKGDVPSKTFIPAFGPVMPPWSNGHDDSLLKSRRRFDSFWWHAMINVLLIMILLLIVLAVVWLYSDKDKDSI